MHTIIEAAVHPECQFLLQGSVDEKLGDALRLTVIATGIHAPSNSAISASARSRMTAAWFADAGHDLLPPLVKSARDMTAPQHVPGLDCMYDEENSDLPTCIHGGRQVRGIAL